MTILQLLASNSFITYNKHIAKKLGIEEAILLGALCSYQVSFGGNEFYKRQEVIMDDTALTLYSVRKAFKTLQDNGIVSIVKKGLPSKNYYKVNEDVLFRVLSTTPIENDRSRDVENDSTSDTEINTTCDSENDSTIINNNTINDNTINNKKVSKKKKIETFDDIINAYTDNDILKDNLYEFIKMRKMIKKPLTNRALKLNITDIEKYANNDDETRIAIVQQTLARGYLGMYPVGGKNKKSYKTTNACNPVDDYNELMEMADLMDKGMN